MNALRGELHLKQPLLRYNTWRVGGIADAIYTPADLHDLQCYLQEKVEAHTPIYWLGLGSNVLIRDSGLRGHVIVTNPGLGCIEWLSSTTVRVEAGVPCAKLAKVASQRGMCGAEFLVGIPGTIGGALRMNAGAFGEEIWPLVHSVEIINRQSRLQIRAKSQFQIGYRSVLGLVQDEWFTAAIIELTPGNAEQALAKTKRLLKKRAETQPIGLPSCGSVFRNPPGAHAAELIESCGLKGFSIGKSCISGKHANFIVHEGEGNATEIEALISLAEKRVLEKYGIQLQREVHIWGEKDGISGNLSTS